MSKPTPSQQKMIDTRGANVIVSAGAGSGKSTTLTNRVIEIINSGVSVNNILVVTFTNAAALEIKEKIREALTKNEMYDELTKLDSSYVCTFDSLSLSIVKKYAYKEKLDKNISITDESFITVKTNEFAREVLDEAYLSKDPDFLDMISNTCVKNDQAILDVIIKFNKALDSKVDKESYIDNYESKYFDNKLIEENILTYEHVLLDELRSIINSYEYFVNKLDDTIYPNTIDNFNNHINNLKNIKSYSDFYNNFITNTNKLTLKDRKEPKYDDETQKDLDPISKRFSAYKKKYVYPNLSDFKQDVYSIMPYTKVILKLVKALNLKITNYKKEHKLYTFNDISRLCINILEKYIEVRNELRDKFIEIMIDEYQDTNDIQDRLISLISNFNVCVVGDIKQSIYGFRNANPLIFKKKYDDYTLYNDKRGIKIDLVENFRSRKEVVDCVNTIFNSCMTDKIGKADYKNSHQMIYGNKTYDKYQASQNYNASIINYYSALNEVKEKGLDLSKAEIEAFIIGRDILNKIDTKYQVFNFKEKRLIKNSNGEQVEELVGLRNCEYKDFCILTETATNYETYKKVFEYLGIPLNVLKNDNLTNNYGIIVFKNLLKFINKIYNNDLNNKFELKYLYSSIARSFLFRLKDKDIYDDIINNNIINSDIYKKCLNISKQIDVLTLDNIVLNIINEFDFINKYNTIENLNSGIVLSEYLINSAKSFSDLSYSLDEYISYLDEVVSNGIKLEVDAGGKTKDAVQLMTIHKSKGLEYQIVYYADLYKAFNASDVKGKFLYSDKLGIINPYHKDLGLDEMFYKDVHKYYYNLDLISEKIRLFYVAITRCKEKVIIIDSFNQEKLDDSFIDYDEYTLLRIRSFSGLMNKLYPKFKDEIASINLKDINIDLNYKLTKVIKELEIKDVLEINVNKININDEIDDNKISYSKKSYKIKDKLEKERLEFGELMHYILECLDFKDENILSSIDSLNLDNYYKTKLKAFINSDLMKDRLNANIYKEYHFINKGSVGIIDLMLVHDDHIDIIDYKLKNIDDDAYINQLNGYKDYIKTVSDKKINIYLYSILEEKYKKLD